MSAILQVSGLLFVAWRLRGVPSQRGLILGVRGGVAALGILTNAVLLTPSALVTLRMSPYSVSGWRVIGVSVRPRSLRGVVVSPDVVRVIRVHSMVARSANGHSMIPLPTRVPPLKLARIEIPRPHALVFLVVGQRGLILERVLMRVSHSSFVSGSFQGISPLDHFQILYSLAFER